MTPNTKTIAATVEGLPELPTGYDRYELKLPKIGDMIYSDSAEEWYLNQIRHKEVRQLVAVKSTPWYPESWRDDMENVFEVGSNEWPPCKPDDLIELMTTKERLRKEYKVEISTYKDFLDHIDPGNWPCAIRILRRS